MTYGEYLEVKDMPEDLRERAKLVNSCVEEIKAQINANHDDADWNTMEVLVNEVLKEGRRIWCVGIKVKKYEGRYPKKNMSDHPKERGIPGRKGCVQQGTALEQQPVRRLEDAEPGKGGGLCAENRRDRDAVQSDCKPDEGAVRNEREQEQI